MRGYLIFSSFSYQFSRKSIPLISCENVTNPLVSDILRWGWHVQKVSVCPEGVPESSWKPHKSKDLEFLHRSCTLKKISTLKKNIKKNIKKWKFWNLIFVELFFSNFQKSKKSKFSIKIMIFRFWLPILENLKIFPEKKYSISKKNDFCWRWDFFSMRDSDPRHF